MDEVVLTVKQIIGSIQSGKFVDSEILDQARDGISLLTLKNESLLSYISSLLLLAAAQLDRNESVFDKARCKSIEQRVTLEKGIKGLESKIMYQIDKVLRAYRRSIEEALQEKTHNTTSHNTRDQKKPGSESDSESESDIDVTSFRPNLSSMASTGSSSKLSKGRTVSETDDQQEYVAPRISSTVPVFEKETSRRAPRRRDIAMEEYIRETAEAPSTEPSIGSQIMDFGRGGERTERERRKDREIQDYEESNFTRISNVSSKRARKEASQRQRNATEKSFFGEDWGFLDGNNNNKSKRQKTRR